MTDNNTYNNERDEDKIEDLKQRLYSRTENISGHREGKLEKKEYDVASEWEGGGLNEDDFAEDMTKKSDKPGSFLNKLLIFAIIFFVGAIGFAYFSLQEGFNEISPDKIDIEIAGPITVEAGTPLSLEVQVTNRNSVQLEGADIVLTFPEGTRSAVDIRQELQRYRQAFGDIDSGEKIDHVVDAILYGEEGETKQIDIRLEYKVSNSNAIFEKQKTYTVQVGAAPATLSVETTDEINSGKQLQGVVTVRANSDNKVEDLLLVAEYPFGFQFTGANPSPTYGSGIWHIGDLEPEEERKIRFNGTITGQANEERVFRFTLGVQDPQDPQDIGTAFFTQDRDVTIQNPFLGINLLVEGEEDEPFVARSDDQISVTIDWRNNLSTRMTDGRISAQLIGDGFDQESVKSQNGFYRSADDTIVWDSRSDEDLAVVSADEEGSVNLTFRTPDAATLTAVAENPTVDLNVSMEGRRPGETDQEIPQDVIGTALRTIQIATDIGLSAVGAYSTGPFENTGPVPPKVDERTTYTIELSVSNSVNDVSSARLTAVLPQYVEWIGKVDPSEAAIEYNPIGGRISWDIGDIAAGAGYSTSPTTASFQVALTPSLSQVDTAPVILRDIQVEAKDTFTGISVRDVVEGLSTAFLREDPAVGGLRAGKVAR